MSKTVLILGAGVGGLTTADTLRQLLPPEDRIILVDRSFDGTLGLSLLWVLRGWRRPDDVRVRPTAASLPGVEMVTATVAHIDIAAQVVHTDNSVIGYDALVIALGAALNTDAVPGLSDALDADVAGQFYTLDGAAELRAKVEALEHGRIAVAIAGVPFKCPAAPFEAARDPTGPTVRHHPAQATTRKPAASISDQQLPAEAPQDPRAGGGRRRGVGGRRGTDFRTRSAASLPQQSGGGVPWPVCTEPERGCGLVCQRRDHRRCADPGAVGAR